MKETNIMLRDIVSIRDFVQQVILTDFEVDLVQGRYIVDAKSIMGIFALDTLSPIKLVAHTESVGDFFERIDKYVIK
ncbi:MAG: HPr family phosphocarrier protein [Clostridia bacterium]|nr:HPr family phosphocarrier protein [Clostridia bacterium]